MFFNEVSNLPLPEFMDLINCIEEKEKRLDLETMLWFGSTLEKCGLNEHVNCDLGFVAKQAIVTCPNGHGVVK